MKSIFFPAIAAAAFSLSACGGEGDDALGDQAEDQAEAISENLEENGLDAQAEAVEDRGEAIQERIDEADVDVDELSAQEQNAPTNVQ